MFNKDLYAEVERESGFRKKFIAEKMGIGYTRYIAITTGMAPWKLNEMDSVVGILNMKRDLVNRVFLCSEATQNGNIAEETEVTE